MANKIINSQINNVLTLNMYSRKFMTLAENVFQFKNLPKDIKTSYMNKILINQGAIAFFYEDGIESVIALPFNSIGTLDIYGQPQKIQVFGVNNYNKILNKDEFVIMYDNNGQYPLYLDILQYAERYSIMTRTIDINIEQQKTPRIWKVPQGQETTFKSLLQNIDSFSDVVKTYDNILDIEGIQCILEPSPFVSDKIDEQRRSLYAEFLEHIGISHIQYNKKERMVSDEIIDSQGSTIASRFSRFEPRKEAIKQINEKFKDYLEAPIEVAYYDNIPSTEEPLDEITGGDANV